MWDLPRPGLEPVSPALAGRFSTTAPPGKPGLFFLILTFLSSSSDGTSGERANPIILGGNIEKKIFSPEGPKNFMFLKDHKLLLLYVNCRDVATDQVLSIENSNVKVACLITEGEIFQDTFISGSQKDELIKHNGLEAQL